MIERPSSAWTHVVMASDTSGQVSMIVSIFLLLIVVSLHVFIPFWQRNSGTDICPAAFLPVTQASIASNSSSVKVGTPSCWALASLLPAFSPTMR